MIKKTKTRAKVGRPKRSTVQDLTALAKEKPGPMQRMRVVIEVNVPDEMYARAEFNETVVTWAADLLNNLAHDGGEVVFLSTEEVREA